MKRAVLVPGVIAGILAVVLLVVIGFRVLAPLSLPPARQAANSSQDRDEAVTIAARLAATAFMDVDYRDMDARVKKVLALATGTFHDQYAAAQVNLTAAARQGQAVSTGVVRYVGLSQVGPTSAIAFVAADSTVTNKSIEAAKKKGQTVDDKRFYRFQLDMSLVGRRWLVKDLQFVG